MRTWAPGRPQPTCWMSAGRSTPPRRCPMGRSSWSALRWRTQSSTTRFRKRGPGPIRWWRCAPATPPRCSTTARCSSRGVRTLRAPLPWRPPSCLTPQLAPGPRRVQWSRGALEHTATLLSSGLVLIAGGTDAGETPLVSAELYDPATGTWTSTGDMQVARVLHTTNRLANGTVLAVGGMNAAAGHSAELFDPVSGSWTATDGPAAMRQVHTATTLEDGKVLVTGGVGDEAGRTRSAEIYDPASQSWTSVGTMTVPRGQHTAVLLPSGSVLVIAGAGTADGSHPATAEEYDPSSGTWTSTLMVHSASLPQRRGHGRWSRAGGRRLHGGRPVRCHRRGVRATRSLGDTSRVHDIGRHESGGSLIA